MIKVVVIHLIVGRERTFNVLLSCIKQSKPDHETIAMLWICYQENLLLISETSHSSKVQFLVSTKVEFDKLHSIRIACVKRAQT